MPQPYISKSSHVQPSLPINQTAIKLAKDEISHKKTKHIAVKYHYSKEQQDLGTIIISYMSTENNLADFFTKPQHRVQHQQMCKQLGLFV